jgi:hypothetical protein
MAHDSTTYDRGRSASQLSEQTRKGRQIVSSDEQFFMCGRIQIMGHLRVVDVANNNGEEKRVKMTVSWWYVMD